MNFFETLLSLTIIWVATLFTTAKRLPHPVTENGNWVLKDVKNLDHIKITSNELNRSVVFGQEIVERMERLETSLRWSEIHVQRDSPSHGQFIVSQPEQEALDQGRNALVVTKATIWLMNLVCNKKDLNKVDCAKFLSTLSLKSTPIENVCKRVKIECTKEEIFSHYRSLDGSCNNKNNRKIGSSFTQYKRLLYPDYLDGVQEPRRSIYKNPLPSPRAVSSFLIKNNLDIYTDITLALVIWGNFIEHDLSHTPIRKMIYSDSSIECCSPSGNSLSPRYIHPFCRPISVAQNDKYYSKHWLDCMTYVRSVPAIRSDCTFGPIEQINQATHYLDASQIYGSTLNKSSNLRTFHDGLMRVTLHHHKQFLPFSPNPNANCQLNDSSNFCFEAGDSRVNLHPALTSYHTIFVREHNRIATQLQKLNSHWDDETLYQEARRIVIAEIQHITYNEWMPIVLGKKYFDLITKSNTYRETSDPSISNAFASASIRGLSSLINGKLNLYRENRSVQFSINLRDHFNNPKVLKKAGYLDALVRGLVTQPSSKLDLNFDEDVTNYLFSNGVYGFDVFSLDIQRGRDHGLPSYIYYRHLCGLPKVNSFEMLADTMDKAVIETLAKVYENVEDIDLIVGGISEKVYHDSLFGPTLSCLISDQFLRTRHGDRYYYKNENQPLPFSRAQLKEIEKVSLARIFCDNLDQIRSIQSNVFRRIMSTNELKNCDDDSIPKLNLNLWLDSRSKYY